MIRFTSCQAANADTGFANLVTLIGKKMDIRTETLQLSSWEKREQLFLAGAVDIAWVCGWQYVLWHEQNKPFSPLVAPVALGTRYQNRPIYYSDLIVRADSNTHSFADLDNPVWAINEFMSWSGFRVAQHYLEQQGKTWADTAEIYKAGSHEKAIQAVLTGRADAVIIDSTVLEAELSHDPTLAQKIRVIDTTPPTGRPPFIVQPTLPQSVKTDLLDVLASLHTSVEGRQVLAQMGTKRLSAVTDNDYNSMRTMAHLPLK